MEEISAIFRLSGPDVERQRVTITRSGIYIGRVAGNDLVLRDSQISRRHMRFVWQDGGFWIEDMGSSNGVWLNNARLEPNVLRTISPGDVIRLGPYTLMYEQLMGGATSNGGPPPTGVIELPNYGPNDFSPAPAPPRVDERVIVRPPRISDGDLVSPIQGLVPKVKLREYRYPHGIPRDQSNWLQYLPSIYSDPHLDPTHFTGRYLLIFEALLSPIIWMVDNFDLYLSPETAPAEWLQWMASWFDLLLLPELPLERQRSIVRQIGWLFLRRGTRIGLERLLELFFGIKPEIVENAGGVCHFLVRLPLSQADPVPGLGQEVADRLITSQKPAFTAYTLEIT